MQITFSTVQSFFNDVIAMLLPHLLSLDSSEGTQCRGSGNQLLLVCYLSYLSGSVH
jgi:hypothetical protein